MSEWRTGDIYLGIECPFCGAEFHQTREAAGQPCIVHPPAMVTGLPLCVLDARVWVIFGDIGPLLLKITQRSPKITEWMGAWNAAHAKPLPTPPKGDAT